MTKIKTIKASVFIPADLNRKLKKLAVYSHSTKSYLIVEILKASVDKFESTKKKLPRAY